MYSVVSQFVLRSTVQVSEKLNAFRVYYAGTQLFYTECGDSLYV